MQITDMKALTRIFSQRHILYLTNYKPCSPLAPTSFRSRQNTQFSYCFHFTRTQHSAQESCFPVNLSETHIKSSSQRSKARTVWTEYDPISSSVVTRRATSNGEGQVSAQSSGGEKQAPVSNLDYGVGERRYGDVKNVNSGVGLRNGPGLLGRKKKVKGRTSYVCSNCGHSEGQWWAKCMQCGAVNSMVRYHESDASKGSRVSGFAATVGSWLPQQGNQSGPLRLKDVQRGINTQEWRIPLPGSLGDEVARVLGGGLVPGSLVLVGGDPGVGKSTLLLQIAEMLAEGHGIGLQAPVVYISGEESVQQIGNRADRLEIETDDLYIYSSTDIEDILEKIQPLSPRAVIVDSVQTVYLKGVVGSAGGPVQVKECTSALLQFAKRTNIPILLIGHVTKSGDIAGPHVLEHIVDAVLYMEGEKFSSHRLLRSVKNRFGSTDELGVFEMTQSGLQAVSNPSEMFLSEQHWDSQVLAGLAVAVIMDGSRSFIIEIQALCVSSSTISRQFNGIQQSRANMIISVLMKQAGLHLQENAIFLNVVSGLTLTETAGDLAIAAAICSSFLEFAIPGNIAFIGEIGLSGELRTVPRMEKRVNTVAKLGYKMCIIPKSAAKTLGTRDFEGLEVIGCRNLKEVINTVFTSQKQQQLM